MKRRFPWATWRLFYLFAKDSGQWVPGYVPTAEQLEERRVHGIQHWTNLFFMNTEKRLARNTPKGTLTPLPPL